MIGKLQNHVTVTPVDFDVNKDLIAIRGNNIVVVSSEYDVYVSKDCGINFEKIFNIKNISKVLINRSYIIFIGSSSISDTELKYFYFYDINTYKIVKKIKHSYKSKDNVIVLDDYLICGDDLININTEEVKTISKFSLRNCVEAKQNDSMINFILLVENSTSPVNITIASYEYDIENDSIKNNTENNYVIQGEYEKPRYISVNKIYLKKTGKIYDVIYNLKTKEIIVDTYTLKVAQNTEKTVFRNNIGSAILVCTCKDENDYYANRIYCENTLLYECKSPMKPVLYRTSYHGFDEQSREQMVIYNVSTKELIIIKVEQHIQKCTTNIYEVISDDKSAGLLIKDYVYEKGISKLTLKEIPYYGAYFSIIETIKGYVNDSAKIDLKEKILCYKHNNNSIDTYELIKFKFGEFGRGNTSLPLINILPPPIEGYKSIDTKETVHKRMFSYSSIENLQARYYYDNYYPYRSRKVTTYEKEITSDYVLAKPRAMYEDNGYQSKNSYPYKVLVDIPWDGRKDKYLMIKYDDPKVISYEKIIKDKVYYISNKEDRNKDDYDIFVREDNAISGISPSHDSFSGYYPDYSVYKIPDKNVTISIESSINKCVQMYKDGIKLYSIESQYPMLFINENVVTRNIGIDLYENVNEEITYIVDKEGLLVEPVDIPARATKEISITKPSDEYSFYLFVIECDDIEYKANFSIKCPESEKISFNIDIEEFTLLYKENIPIYKEEIAAKGFCALILQNDTKSFILSNDNTSIDFKLLNIYKLSDIKDCKIGSTKYDLSICETIVPQNNEIEIKEDVIDHGEGYNLKKIKETIHGEKYRWVHWHNLEIKEKGDGYHEKDILAINEKVPSYGINDNYICNELYKINFDQPHGSYGSNIWYYKVTKEKPASKYHISNHQAVSIIVNKDDKVMDFSTLYSLKLKALQDIESVDVIIGYDEITYNNEKYVRTMKVKTFDCRYGWNNYEFLPYLRSIIEDKLDHDFIDSNIETDRIKYFAIQISSENDHDQYLEFDDFFAYKKTIGSCRDINLKENVLIGTTDDLRGVFYPSFLNLYSKKGLCGGIIYYNSTVQVHYDDECIRIKNPNGTFSYFSPRRLYIVLNAPITRIYGYNNYKEKTYEYTGYEGKYVYKDGKYYYDFYLETTNKFYKQIDDLCISINDKDNVGENFEYYDVTIYECAVWLNGYMKFEHLTCIDRIFSYLPSERCRMYEEIIQPKSDLPIKEFYTKERGGTRVLSVAERIIRLNDKFGERSLSTKENVKPFRFHRDLDLTELVPCKPINDGVWIYENAIKDTKIDMLIKEKVVNIKNGKDAKVMVEIVKY